MNKSNAADSGCFSGMLRLLLCKGSVPAHPSDNITNPMAEFESSTKDLNSYETKAEAPGEPGIVARLMGLESNWVPKQSSPTKVLRSKSVNFVDYLLEFDCSQAQAPAYHRRTRSSSFREVPPLLNQKKDFLVLCLTGASDESREKSSSMRKFEVGFGVVREGKDQREKKKENIKQSGAKIKAKQIQRKKNKISNLKDEPRRDVRKQTSNARRTVNPKPHPQKKPLKSQKEGFGESRVTKKGKNQRLAKKMDTLLDSENLSPISVLDMENFSTLEQIHLLPVVSSSTEITKSKPSLKLWSQSDDPATKKESEEYAELVGKLNVLSEKDMRASEWMIKSATELEEICTELEQQILDFQLLQVLEEIV